MRSNLLAAASVALSLAMLLAAPTKGLAIEFKSQADKDRFESLIKLQTEMKNKLAAATKSDEIPGILALYKAKAQNILSKPIAVKFKWDKRTTDFLFLAKSIRIREAVVDESKFEIGVQLEITIVAKISKSMLGLEVTIDNEEYQIHDFMFIDKDGTVLAMDSLLYISNTPIEKGTSAQVIFYSLPLSDI